MLFVAVLRLKRKAGAFQKAFPVGDWERGTNYELRITAIRATLFLRQLFPQQSSQLFES